MPNPDFENLNPHFPIDCTLRFAPKFVSFILPVSVFISMLLLSLSFRELARIATARFSGFAGLLGFVSVSWDTALP